jgi:hypothetical protein
MNQYLEWFCKIIQKIFRKIFTLQIGYLFFALAIIYLFLPYIAGWIDVVFPSIAIFAVLLYFYAFTNIPIFYIVPLAYLLFLSIFAFIHKRSNKFKTISLSLIVMLIVISLIIYQPFKVDFLPGPDQFINSHPVGAYTKLIWVGGLERVKKDALSLFTAQTDAEGYVNPEVWPNSLKKLNADDIQVKRELQLVYIWLPPPHYFDHPGYCYLITNGESPNSEIFNSNNYFLWQLGEGVYFVEFYN